MADDPQSAGNINLHRKEKSHVRRYTCLTAFLAVLIVLCLLAVVGARWLRSELLSRLTADQLADLEKAQTEIVHLPRDWHQPARLVPEKIQRFHDELGNTFYPTLRRHDRLVYGSSDDDSTKSLFGRLGYAMPVMDDDQRTSYALLMAEAGPLIDEATSIVLDADYSLQTDMKAPQFLAVQSFAKLMSVKAGEEAERGDYAAAVDSLALPLRMARRPEQSWLITHLIGVAIGNISLNTMNHILDQTTDTKALRQALDVLTETKTHQLLDPGLLEFTDYLSQLRIAAALGAPVDIGPQTRASMLYQMRWIYSEHYYQWLLENLPAGDSRLGFVRSQIASYKTHFAGGGDPWYKGDIDKVLNRLTTRGVEPLPTTHSTGMLRLANGLVDLDFYLVLHYFVYVPNVLEAETRNKVTQTYFDLLRLKIAQRLAVLEGGVAAGESANVQHLRAYLDTVPTDPFTSAPYLLTPDNRFYSAGPDKADDGNRILYDATNGTSSAGDVDFRPLFDPSTKKQY